ncbi:hypothetical protein, partial [Leptospira borgpetersenii]|uniref:hypothetical protein n=1 Tax=Leptospira borgpetersenii TaxID=174 RepID=UPI0027DC32D8
TKLIKQAGNNNTKNKKKIAYPRAWHSLQTAKIITFIIPPLYNSPVTIALIFTSKNFITTKKSCFLKKIKNITKKPETT